MILAVTNAAHLAHTPSRHMRQTAQSQVTA
jgi:hypothetical protein